MTDQAAGEDTFISHLVELRDRLVLSDCTDEHAALLGKMLALAPKLAEQNGIAVKTAADGTPGGGFKTLINAGPDGGQEVYHLHLHMYGGPRPWRGLGL